MTLNSVSLSAFWADIPTEIFELVYMGMPNEIFYPRFTFENFISGSNLGDVDENRDFRCLSHEMGILIAEKNERARPVAVVGSAAVNVIKRFAAA